MKKVSRPGTSYSRVEAILEFPTWALVVALILMTVAVVVTTVAQL